MATKAGVWIDHKQAVVVLITDGGQETKKIAFAVGQTSGAVSEGSSKKKYTPNDFVADDKRGRKVENDRKVYYDDVIACIKGADALLILGPGEAKGEFSKQIKAKKVRGVVVELETTDKMTDRQIAAKVQKHFAAVSVTKAAAPKKTVKKAAKTTAKRSTKKSSK